MYLRLLSLPLLLLLQFFHYPVISSHQLPPQHTLQILKRLGFAKETTGAEIIVGEKKRTEDSPIYYIKLPPLPYYYSPHNSIQTTPHPFQQLALDFTSNGRPDQVYHWNMPPTTPHYWPPGIPPQIPPNSMSNIHQQYTVDGSPAVIPEEVEEDLPIYEPPQINPVVGGGQIPVIPPLILSPIPASSPNEAVDPLESYKPNKPSLVNEIDFNDLDEIKSSFDIVPSATVSPVKVPSPGNVVRPTPHPSLSNDILGIPNKIPSEKKKPWLQIGKEKGMYVYNGRPDNIYIWRPKSRHAQHKRKHPMFLHFNY